MELPNTQPDPAPECQLLSPDAYGLPMLYLKSEGTEAFRVRIDESTRKTVALAQVSYLGLGGKAPSLSLLVRRALNAHLAEVAIVLKSGTKEEKQAFYTKMLEGAPQ